MSLCNILTAHSHSSHSCKPKATFAYNAYLNRLSHSSLEIWLPRSLSEYFLDNSIYDPWHHSFLLLCTTNHQNHYHLQKSSTPSDTGGSSPYDLISNFDQGLYHFKGVHQWILLYRQPVVQPTACVLSCNGAHCPWSSCSLSNYYGIVSVLNVEPPSFFPTFPFWRYLFFFMENLSAVMRLLNGWTQTDCLQQQGVQWI